MTLSTLIARCAAAAISVALIACTDSAPPPPDPSAAEQVGAGEALPHVLPPPSAGAPRYVGIWASASVGCAVPAWTIRADSLSTLGEVACSFNDVRMTGAGYAIQATCTAENPPAPYQLELSFAESARAMMISGAPWDQAPALVYCGPLPQD